jgi:hypothetical protein
MFTTGHFTRPYRQAVTCRRTRHPDPRANSNCMIIRPRRRAIYSHAGGLVLKSGRRAALFKSKVALGTLLQGDCATGTTGKSSARSCRFHRARPVFHMACVRGDEPAHHAICRRSGAASVRSGLPNTDGIRSSRKSSNWVRKPGPFPPAWFIGTITSAATCHVTAT